MRKWLSILVAASLMVSMAIPSMAEEAVSQGVPSKTTSDTNQVQSVVSSTGEKLPETFTVEVVAQDPEPVNAVKQKLFESISNPEATENAAPINFFGEDVKKAVSEHLGNSNIVLEQLELNEFVTVAQNGYDEAFGDVDVTFVFATKYQPGQTLVGLMGFFSENNEVEWQVVTLVVNEDGSVSAKLTQEQLQKFNDSVATSLAVLSEPMV